MPEDDQEKPADGQELKHILDGATPNAEYKDLMLDRVKQDKTNYMIYRDGEYITTINADTHKTTHELRETVERYTRTNG